MSISKQKVESFSAIIQDLSEKLRLISSNSKFMQPKCINLEMKNLSNSVQQIAPILLKAEEHNHRNKFSSEFAEVSYEIDHVLQSYSTNRDIHKVASELKAIHVKLEKITKKLQSNINAKEENTMKMTLKNTPIETLTVSGKREEKENIINLLLQPEPCIVPIIHKYKPNSTEFARDIFEDKRIANHFTRAIWVDAPRLIDTKKLDSLVQRRPSTLFWVIKTLNKDVEEVRVLLVLDDIKKKLPLGNLFIKVNSIQTKSKIYVSTGEKGGWYSDEEIEGSKKMSVEEAWKVIDKEGKANNLEYERIGKEMLEKMERWGSMVEALMTLLLRNREIWYWRMMVESQFWRIPCDEEEVLSTLVGLCYDMSPLETRLYHLRFGGKQKICTLFW